MATFRTSRAPLRTGPASLFVAALTASITTAFAANAAATPSTSGLTVAAQARRASASPARPTAIVNRTHVLQRGPHIVVAGKLEVYHPRGSGIVTLRLVGAPRRALGSAYPGAHGVFSFVVTLPGAVVGDKRFRIGSACTTQPPLRRPRARSAST